MVRTDTREPNEGDEPMISTKRGGQRLEDQKAASLRLPVLAFATFAVGTGTFIVTGLLGGVARDLSVSVGTAGHLVTVFAFALLSPVLVAATAHVQRRRLLVTALALFALANAAAAVAPTF
jgi:MFS transporter, DHA1 family, inner membrane transport protein